VVPITVYRYLSITSVWRTNIYHKYVSQAPRLLVITMYNIPIQIRVSNCKPSHPGMRGSLKSKWVGWFNYYGSKALVVSDPAANRDDKPLFFSPRLSKEVQVHFSLNPWKAPIKMSNIMYYHTLWLLNFVDIFRMQSIHRSMKKTWGRAVVMWLNAYVYLSSVTRRGSVQCLRLLHVFSFQPWLRPSLLFSARNLDRVLPLRRRASSVRCPENKRLPGSLNCSGLGVVMSNCIVVQWSFVDRECIVKQ
jgi:hypothetical protein